MNRVPMYPIIQALLAAALFGASTPVAKWLLDKVEPIPLAAFLYLGSGIGLLLFRVLQRMGNRFIRVEAPVRKTDLAWLTAAVLAGGVAAPILLMFSLRTTQAATASLLLNFEGTATALIAALVFKEAIAGRVWWAIGCVTVGSVMLSMDLGAEWGFSFGAAGVLGACAFWGLDNNLTRGVSARDPVSIVMIKGLGAGSFSLLLSLLQGVPFPEPLVVFGAMLLGSFGYGFSIVIFVLAMRGLGTARASAFFGTAPFIGAFVSFLFLGETPDLFTVVSIPMMIVGAILLLSEKHAHRHVHAAIEHDHRHRHDNGHHVHEHEEDETLADLHAHPHTHDELEHLHPHAPEIHHRHDHKKKGRD